MKERIKNLRAELAQPDLDLHRKVDILNELAWFFRASDNASSVQYTAQASEIASKINYESGLLYVKMMKAFEVYFKGNPADSLMDLQEILKKFEQIEDDKGRGRTMIFMSVAHWSMANYKDGFKYVNEALALAEETKAEERISWANYILGTFYMDLKDYENSLACLERAMFFFEKTEDLTGKIACMSSIGGILQATGKYEQALKQHQESYDFAKKISQEGQLARALHDIGIVYESLEELEIALDYLKQSLEIRLKIQNQQGIISCHNNIGRVLMKLNKFEESLEHLREGEKMCREINAKNKLIPIIKLQADVYKKMGNAWQALDYLEKYIVIRKEVSGEENQIQLNNMKSIYGIEKAQKESEIQRLRNVELKSAYEQIESQTKKIIDSIKYAKRIQQSILIPIEQIQKHFRESFVFYLPKDIVSGDFYWFSNKGNQLVLAAVDCTGHGVPGAFMVVMANALLNEIINEKNVLFPTDILTDLDNKLRKSLHKSEGENGSRDGMDLSLIILDTDKNEIHFSGAKNPLYWIRNHEIEQIRGSKFPIGGTFMQAEKYKTHSLKTQKDDIFYIFSDGFADQFGGEMNQKYMSKRFRELLLDISVLSLNEQKLVLENEFTDWKGKNKQTDDILVMGIKI